MFEDRGMNAVEMQNVGERQTTGTAPTIAIRDAVCLASLRPLRFHRCGDSSLAVQIKTGTLVIIQERHTQVAAQRAGYCFGNNPDSADRKDEH